MEPKYELRLNVLGDDWPSLLAVLKRFSDMAPGMQHITGSATGGVSYTVDVSEVEVVSEPPAKVRA